jgi:hypothetical protein
MEEKNEAISDLSENSEEWGILSELQQKLIIKGLVQADAGLGLSLNEVNKRLREKHGILNKES